MVDGIEMSCITEGAQKTPGNAGRLIVYCELMPKADGSADMPA